MASPWVIQVEKGHRLLPCDREKRTRRGAAYTIVDAKSGTVILSQKLQYAVMYINRFLAQARRERVTVQGLFEAADSIGNRVDGFHKMRYRIHRCEVDQAHTAFEVARQEAEAQRALILTDNPDAYPVALV